MIKAEFISKSLGSVEKESSVFTEKTLCVVLAG